MNVLRNFLKNLVLDRVLVSGSKKHALRKIIEFHQVWSEKAKFEADLEIRRGSTTVLLSYVIKWIIKDLKKKFSRRS